MFCIGIDLSDLAGGPLRADVFQRLLKGSPQPCIVFVGTVVRPQSSPETLFPTRSCALRVTELPVTVASSHGPATNEGVEAQEAFLR